VKKRRFPSPCRAARIILHIELPLTVLYAVVFLISYLMAAEANFAYAIVYYRPLLVTLLYPVMITAFSILLVERLALKE